jgi:hypothetical protein
MTSLAELEDQAARTPPAMRAAQITASTSALIRHGCDFGACDRSASPSIPLSR